MLTFIKHLLCARRWLYGRSTWVPFYNAVGIILKERRKIRHRESKKAAHVQMASNRAGIQSQALELADLTSALHLQGHTQLFPFFSL